MAVYDVLAWLLLHQEFFSE